ncbi:MAG: DUF3617 family protein [Proteobacteria bacterium]|nr:DUF3617 family protein [Pseudomonadota bacterium]
MKTLTAFAAAGLVLLASPAFAATQLQPGEWQTTETGTENGQAVPPKVDKECIAEDEARDAASLVNEMKKEITGQGVACQTADVQQNGDTVTYTLKCAMQQQFVFNISGTYTLQSPTRYSGRMKSEITMMGQKAVSDKAVEAVRIGDCKPGAGKN